jgi:hypothetical protein
MRLQFASEVASAKSPLGYLFLASATFQRDAACKNPRWVDESDILEPASPSDRIDARPCSDFARGFAARLWNHPLSEVRASLPVVEWPLFS